MPRDLYESVKRGFSFCAQNVKQEAHERGEYVEQAESMSGGYENFDNGEVVDTVCAVEADVGV